MHPPSRIAVISAHSCPLARPGTHDAGGMNVYIRETARVMASRGVEVDIFTRTHSPRDEEPGHWPDGCRVIHIPAGPAAAAKSDLLRSLDTFVNGVLEHARRHGRSYDGIISHYWLSGLAAQRLRDHWTSPHVAAFHTLLLAKPPAFQDDDCVSHREAGERKVVSQADALLAATDHEHAVLAANYKADPGRIVTAPPGVDTEHFRPFPRGESCRQLGLSESGFRLLFAGRTIPMKGIPVLIEALTHLPTDISAVIVGGSAGDPEQRYLQEVATRFGVAHRVRFEGSVPHERLPLYFGASDVCVVPSYHESYGMVALEALACGRPVVASRVGGLASVVDHGVSGLLIPPGSPPALSDAILALRTNQRYRRSMAEAGVVKARRCSWESTTEAILRALSEPAGAKGPVLEPSVAAAG